MPLAVFGCDHRHTTHCVAAPSGRRTAKRDIMSPEPLITVDGNLCCPYPLGFPIGRQIGELARWRGIRVQVLDESLTGSIIVLSGQSFRSVSIPCDDSLNKRFVGDHIAKVWIECIG